MSISEPGIESLGPQETFKRYLREGKIMLQRSRSTGRYIFYPRMQVPLTGETDLEWVEAKGTGTVYAATLNRTRKESYNIVLIDLDEGVRLMSHVVDAELPAIGTRVTALIREMQGEPALVFRISRQGEKL